jgi:hypothetical protein
VGTLTEPMNYHQRDDKQYHGSFRHGQRHGQGVQTWSAMVYDGAWQEDQMHGLGVLTWTKTGASYQGLFAQGRYDGHGRYQSDANGLDGYVGQWKHGLKWGVGKEYCSDGSVYEGDFVADQKEGFGCMVFPSKKIYSGGWKGGVPYGQGMEIDQHGSLLRCGVWGDDDDVIDHKRSGLHPEPLTNAASPMASPVFSDRSSGFPSVCWDY